MKCTARPQRRIRGAGLLLLLASRATAASDDLQRHSWLNLNAPESVLELRGERDSVVERIGDTSLVRRERYFQERLRTDLSGNVYDERFLGFSLGAGFTLSQDKVSGGSGERFTRAFDDEYRGNVSLFPKHPVSASMFAERVQSTPHNVFAGKTRLESTGLRGGLSLKSGPAPMSLAYWESSLTGGGFGQPFDQHTRGLSWTGVTRPRKSFSASFKQYLERFRELSSPGYDYAASSLLLEGSPIDKQRFTSQTRYEHRKGSISMRLIGMDAGWGFLGDRIRTDARYGFEEKTSDSQKTQRQSASARAEHRLYDSLTSAIGIDSDWSREKASRSSAQKIELQEDYIKSLWGPLRFSGHYGRSLRLEQSGFDALLNTVLDEPHALSDGSVTYLKQLSVDPASVYVLSEDKQRRYREGIDYQLLAQGALLEIRRIITGNIINGATVLVSYQNTMQGKRRTRDTAQGLRFALLLGSRGSVFFSENRQSQIITEAIRQFLAPNLESYRERAWGCDVHWKYLGTSQIWRSRESNISPLRAYSSSLRVGGEIFSGASLFAGWTYDVAHFSSTNAQTIGRDYFAEGRLAPARHLEFRTEGRMGDTSAPGGMSGKYRMALGQMTWSYRSVELELSDRFTRRWVSNSFSEENFFQVRMVRRL